MRALFKNVLNDLEINASSEDDYYAIKNMLNLETKNVGRFLSKTYAKISVEGAGYINSIAIFNTNAYLIRLEIIGDKTITYDLNISGYSNIYNIEETTFRFINIYFYGKEDNKNNLEVGSLVIGKAYDFPAHDKSKTHTVNYTKEQFFSAGGHYFARRIPFKRYDEWKVSFPLLTNDDRQNILNFFDESNFSPFALQVWREGDIVPSYFSKHAKYDVSKYNISKYASKKNINIEKTSAVLSRKRQTVNENKNVKYYMKSGLYVCTNDKIEFKKSKNDVYQYSIDLTFREVK